MLLTPLITCKLYPPELKRVDNKRSPKRASKLGPMTLREKMLSCLFVSGTGRLGVQQRHGVNAESTVAICVMALMLVLKIVTGMM